MGLARRDARKLFSCLARLVERRFRARCPDLLQLFVSCSIEGYYYFFFDRSCAREERCTESKRAVLLPCASFTSLERGTFTAVLKFHGVPATKRITTTALVRDRGDHFKVVGLKNLAKTNKHYGSLFRYQVVEFIHYLYPCRMEP